LKKEIGFAMILDGAVVAHVLREEIKTTGLAEFRHTSLIGATGDAKNASLATAAELHETGMPSVCHSVAARDVPKTRIVLYEAAVAAAHGLPHDAALDALSKIPAQLLDIAANVGSLKEGKDAVIVLFDGVPLEYTTHITSVVVDGKVIKE